MKPALILIAIASLLFPLQGNSAGHGISAASSSILMAAQKNTHQNLRVKNRQQATQMVKGRYNAKVLSVQSSRVNGNPGYRAKLLSKDGVVFYVAIDAVTGQMSRQ
ncbi:PepSY domain-containing protein [Shewanella aquimarina]|uniref:PepSY domain-containing protein n=1 Tax=Shewanella aquimarina TaxID=260365 RepID=UPI002014E4EF|nr:PepSY domain-containing protein [Shewanella aquimarina]MCL2908758.1 PepSY domain-containing protein [Shewanella aquimarina]